MVWLLDWAYRVQLVVEAADRGVTQAERWERGLLGPSCVLGAGPRVDGGTQSGIARCHEDAEAVHAAVLGNCQGLVRGLIIHYARCGGAPEWWPGAEVRRVPVLRANGKPWIVRDASGNPKGVRMRDGVLVNGKDTGLCPAGLALARDSWAAWADGVWRLAVLKWDLRQFRVVDVGVPLLPWKKAA